MSECHPDLRNIRPPNIISLRSFFIVVLSQKLLLFLMREATLQNAVPRDLTQVARAQLPHLRSDGVFLHECFLCVMKLHGVVGREGDVQPLVQEFPQRVLGIFQEKAVVAKRRHGNGDLGEVVEVLQHWTLLEEQPVGNVVGCEGRQTPGE